MISGSDSVGAGGSVSCADDASLPFPKKREFQAHAVGGIDQVPLKEKERGYRQREHDDQQNNDHLQKAMEGKSPR
jgi:hypothetical protein